jgi:hypothetical protein
MALVTPFGTEVDYKPEGLVEFHLRSGTHGIALRHDRRVGNAEPSRT